MICKRELDFSISNKDFQKLGLGSCFSLTSLCSDDLGRRNYCLINKFYTFSPSELIPSPLSGKKNHFLDSCSTGLAFDLSAALLLDVPTFCLQNFHNEELLTSSQTLLPTWNAMWRGFKLGKAVVGWVASNLLEIKSNEKIDTSISFMVLLILWTHVS